MIAIALAASFAAGHWTAEALAQQDAGAVQVSAAHKASRIVGAKVKDYSNQDLGEIKDVVMDIQTGRIHYVALAVPLPDRTEKLVAVPPGALTRAAGEEAFLLNADRSRLLSAVGFPATSWPVIADTAWGAQNQRGAAFQEYHITPYAVTASTAAPVAASSVVNEPSKGVFKGKIHSVNPKEGYLEVESPSGEVRRMMFDDRPVIVLKDSRNARIVDLKVGYPVNVSYRREGGNYVAYTIIRTDTVEVK